MILVIMNGLTLEHAIRQTRQHYNIRFTSKKDGSDFRIPQMEWDSEKKIFINLEKLGMDEFISYPVDGSGQMRSWKWSIETFNQSKETELQVRLDTNKQPAVYMKARMKSSGMLPLTWWDKTEYSATAYGTNLLSKILGERKKFDYPKSLYAVIDCVKVASDNPNAIVLDFFCWQWNDRTCSCAT